MDVQDRVTALYYAQREGADELSEELSEAHVEKVKEFEGSTSHVTRLYEIVLETGRLAYFKPLNAFPAGSPGARALVNYGHTLDSMMIAECAAWEIARQLGPPWSDLVAPTVVRSIRVSDAGPEVGSLTVYRPGRDKSRAFYQAVPDQAAWGAFFDCLIGQQDRNRGNVLWQESRGRIHLIDHGFAFGVAGAQTGELELTAWRWNHGDRTLSADELRAVSSLVDADGFGTAEFLDAARAEALLRRAAAMRQDRSILEVGVL